MTRALQIITLVAAAALAGCATEDRYLTKEQDAEIARLCAESCAIVPRGVFEEMVARLRGQAI